MRALVTGANGFLGSHMCERLLAGGHTVRAMVRRTSDLRWIRDTGVELAYADLADSAALARAVAGIDRVFHAAAAVRPRDPRDYERVNAEGTRAMAEACAGAGVSRLVFFSSVAAAGPARSPGRPMTEADAVRPVSAYGRGKLAAERVLIELKDRVRSVVLRFPAVYGPRDRDGLVLLRSLKRGVRPVLGGTFSVVYVSDAVRAAELAAGADVGSGSVYYISDGECYSYDEMAGIAEGLIGTKTLRVRVPGWALGAAARVSEWLSREGSILNRDKARELVQDCWACDTTRAREELGFEPEYRLDRGLAETVRWYQERNWL